jgi:hydroxylamine reductase (hybrid-cluster protein)
MPATVALAKARNIAVIATSSLEGESKISTALGVAAKAFAGRRGKGVRIPAAEEQLHTGYTAENCKPLLAALKDASAREVIKGIVYLGGCGTVAQTQDAGMVQTAAGLLAEGYLVATAGCAGAALARAGMCRPEYAVREGLEAIASIGAPAVLHLGACHDAGEFLLMAGKARELGIPVFAVFQEIGRNKIWSTAVAFAAQGIRTFVDAGEAGTLPEMTLAGELLTLGELEKFMMKSTKVAAGK